MEPSNNTLSCRGSFASRWRLGLATLLCAIPFVVGAQTVPTINIVPTTITINEDQSTNFTFTVSNGDGGSSGLSFGRSSLNPALIPTNNISITGSGGTRTITLSPLAEQNGSALIGVSVTDADGTASDSFTLTVNAVNDPPSFTGGSDVTVQEDSGGESINNWATNISPGPANESGQTLTFNVTVNSRSDLFSVAPAINSSGRLTFTVAGNKAGTASVTARLSDNGGTANGGNNQSAAYNFSITVTPVNDPPTVTGTFPGTSGSPLQEGAANVQLFANVTIGDVDQGQPNNEILTVTVTPGTNFANFGSFAGVEGISLSGTPSQVTTALRTNLFNVNSSISSGSFDLTIEVCDGDNACDTLTGTIHLQAVNDPPAVGVTMSPATITDSQDVLPFEISIEDPDPPVPGDQYTVIIEPVNDPTFLYGALLPANPRFTNTLEQVIALVRSVEYHPVRDSVAVSTNIQFRVRVIDSGGAEGTALGTLTVIGVNDPPSISGISLNILRLTDDPTKPPVHPFATVRVVDVDEGGNQILRATLSLDNPALGSLVQSNLSLFGPSISITNTGALLTEAINSVTFVPTQRVDRAVGETVTAHLLIRVVDSRDAAAEDDRTTLAITSVNGSPQILLNGSLDFPDEPLLIPPTVAVKPFSGILIRDDDLTNVTVNVTLDDATKGVLANLNGFTLISPGVYQIVAPPAAATTALNDLVFQVSTNFLFPPSEPGGTTFTIQAVDSVLNTTTRTLQILLQDQPRNHLVTDDTDDVYPPNYPVVAERGRSKRGTLRRALQDASNNDVITFALPGYPALIRLDKNRGPLELIRNVNLKGPGADLLTISGDTDGNQEPDTQIFRVFASVVMEGLTLTQGRDRSLTAGPDDSITGGAVFVGSSGRLVLRSCAVTDSQSTQWGGAIDVMEGSLILYSCLVRGNFTDDALGLGGGAISLYTDLPCAFTNTTFSGNRQASANGFGGGAIYAENFTPSTELAVSVTHCTFGDNFDAADLGSSINANVFGTVVSVRNSVFADGQGRNLEVQGAGRIVSLGGNVSDDPTRTTLVQGGQPKLVILLSGANDLTEAATDQLLEMPLNETLGPTALYALKAGSPAIGRAVSPTLATDQRGVIRDAAPDAGAMEFDAFGRVVINEIQFDPDPASTNDTAFVELYVPRDAVPMVLSNFSLWIDGTNRHSFAPNTLVRPGYGILVADKVITLNPTNNPTTIVLPAPSPLSLTNRGLIELRKDNQPVAAQTFNGVFVDPDNVTNRLDLEHNSLTLAPQFKGFALVPHRMVEVAPPSGATVEGVDLTMNGPATSPGKDTRNAAFGLKNALPFAAADSVVVNEDEQFTLLVLNNDRDADRLDQLVIVDVSRTSGPGSGDAATATSDLGAWLSVMPTNAPLRGTAVLFDPRNATNLQQLAEGAKATDTFYYEIIDIGAGPILDFTNGNGGVVVVSPNHRLTNGEAVVISGAGVAEYNGTHTITNFTDDTFSLALAFQTNPPVKGTWITQQPRRGTQRDEAQVTLTVLGANDPPSPGTDFLATDEETVLRIMGDADLAGNNTIGFDTDAQYPPPRTNPPISLLANDRDIDDDPATLLVVGVVGEVHAITNYEGTPGVAPVIVRAPNHGLADGTEVLISGYGGHPSYNGFHTITRIDDQSFSIPVPYVDNHTNSGVWTILDDANRLTATSQQGAAVQLEIRANRRETSVVYNPRASTNLNALARLQTTNDTFFYAVQDPHGALTLAEVTVTVTGVNDLPVPGADPGSLTGLDPLLGVGQSPAQALSDSTVDYYLPPMSGRTNRIDAQLEFAADGSPQSFLLTDLWITGEDTPLNLLASDLLSNDTDVDTRDTLSILPFTTSSEAGANVKLAPNGLAVIYDSTTAPALQALAREELLLDTFEITVTDGEGGEVTSLVAVLVVGVNDTPVAQADSASTTEDTPLVLNPLLYPLNNPSHYDWDADVNGQPPDNQLALQSVIQLLDVGAAVSVFGNTVSYDPSMSAFLNGLPEGIQLCECPQIHGERRQYVLCQ